MARRQPKYALTLAAAVIIVTLVGVVVPLVVARHFGASGIPRSDDWSYLKALFHWVDAGQLDFNNFVSMTLLGQLVLAAPIVQIFGNDITTVQVTTALLGLVGLLGVLALGVIVTRRVWVATFLAVMVAVGPLWGALTVSFMTDVPAFVFSVLACTLGARALAAKRVSLPYLAAALAAAFIGFTIRQYAVVPFVAIVLVGGWALWREGRGRRWRTFLGIAAGLVVASILVFAYWRTIPNLKSLTPELPDAHSLRATFYKATGMLRLLGLLVAPAIVLAGPVRIVRRAWAAASATMLLLGAIVVLALAYAAVEAPRIALAGNYVLPNGILGNAVLGGNRPDILPTGGWTLLVLIGTLGALLLVLALVPALVEIGTRLRDRDLTPREPIVVFLGLVIVGYVITYLFAAATGLPMADRYVLPILPLAAVLLLRGREVDEATTTDPFVVDGASTRLRLVLAGVALAVLMGVGAVYALDSASYDGTRWRVAVAATRDGWTPRQIRGGFEWTNFYARGPHGSNRGPAPCVTVIVDPPGGRRDLFVVKEYRSPLVDPVLIGAVQTRKACRPAGRGQAANP
jgi:hypothetical protein